MRTAALDRHLRACPVATYLRALRACDRPHHARHDHSYCHFRIEEEGGTYESPGGEGGSWREPLARALASASRFSFVQPIATFGIAVLLLLQESDWNEDPKFLARTIAFAWQQATSYPTFTQPPVKLERPLTPTEEKVLRLIPQTSRMPLSARSWTSSFRL